MTVRVLEKEGNFQLRKEKMFLLCIVKLHISKVRSKANLEMQIHLKEDEMRLEDMKADLEKEIVGLQND